MKSMSPETLAFIQGPDRPWWTCVVPFIVFLAAGILEPTPGGGGIAGFLGIPYAAYPVV